jgi:uncharacterized protein (TIGR02145 family)
MKNIIILVFLLSTLTFFETRCQTKGVVTSTRQGPKGMIDSRDKQIYSIVNIGTHIWMAENMRYNAEGSWLNGENPSIRYGRLYNWETAQKACPPGFHLATDDEWKALEMVMGMKKSIVNEEGWRGGNEGTKMKSNKGWGDAAEGTNNLGINILPAGDCSASGSFFGLGGTTSFWTATSIDLTSARNRHFDSGKEQINRYNKDKKTGLSCRCVKD